MIDLATEFPLRPGLIYLNHAAVAPWPRRTARAVELFARENMLQGAADYPRWMRVEAELREQLRQLLGARQADDVALLKNTSEGLSLVAQGLPWQPGDNVVITDQEFPSNRIVWESLRPSGVEVREVPVGGSDPEAELISALDSRTRLLAVSAVQYATGLRMELARLGAACRRAGVVFCVDAIQSLGALPLDVEAQQIDFVAADAHKWLLGPEGIAVFWCRPELRDRLRLYEYGWHMVEHPGDYERRDWTPAASARRFECGSPNMVGIHALHASLSLLLEVGMDKVAAAIAERSERLVAGCEARGLELLTPRPARRRAGIVTFRHRTLPAALLHERLKAAGVVCAPRGGGIRFSPHFYTPLEALDEALATLEGLKAL